MSSFSHAGRGGRVSQSWRVTDVETGDIREHTCNSSARVVAARATAPAERVGSHLTAKFLLPCVGVRAMTLGAFCGIPPSPRSGLGSVLISELSVDGMSHTELLLSLMGQVETLRGVRCGDLGGISFGA